MNLFDDDFENDDVPDDEIVDAQVSEIVPAHPRAAAYFAGHAAIEQELLSLFASGRMPHALIFTGQMGIGKASMAFRLARFLFKYGAGETDQGGLFGASEPVLHMSLDVPENDPVFSRVAAGGHADLLAIERPYDETKDKYKSAIDVNEIRKVAPFLRKTSGEGGWRIVIIDDADTMGRNAQNALLKILEEPPENTLIILIAHRAGALIPTIRSRSRVVYFDALPEDVFQSLLARFGHRFSQSDMETLRGLSQGSIGRALKVIENEGLIIARKTLDLMMDENGIDRVAVHSFAENFAGGEEALIMLSDIFSWIYGAMARAKACGLDVPPGFGVHHKAMQNMLSRYRLNEILETMDALHAHFDKAVHSNLDKRQAVLGGFSLITDKK